jgi:hypothetical protein
MQPKGPNQPKPKFAKSVGIPVEVKKGYTLLANPAHAQKLAKALKR